MVVWKSIGGAHEPGPCTHAAVTSHHHLSSLTLPYTNMLHLQFSESQLDTPLVMHHPKILRSRSQATKGVHRQADSRHCLGGGLIG